MELALINLTLSAVMTGLIWTIQTVHYPSFLFLDEHGFPAGYRHHLRSIVPLTGVLMSAELACFFWWWYTLAWAPSLWVPAACLAWIWGATFLVHIPQHRKLTGGYSPPLIRTLVRTNWGRTLAWTLRTLWLLWWVAGQLAG